VRQFLTLGDIARHCKIPVWQVRRLYENGVLSEPARAGRYRLVPFEELPAIEAALRTAGYLADFSEVRVAAGHGVTHA
jgi:hypothetical protein